MVGGVWLEISWWCWCRKDGEKKARWNKINGAKKEIWTNLCVKTHFFLCFLFGCEAFEIHGLFLYIFWTSFHDHFHSCENLKLVFILVLTCKSVNQFSLWKLGWEPSWKPCGHSRATRHWSHLLPRKHKMPCGVW
jgi:hypothetical protein